MSGPSSFNDWLAVRITSGVGTMWCAYAFTVLSLVSLPGVLATHSVVNLVSWVAQTFLQLVLLSILMVGQKVIDAKHDATAASVAELHEKHDALHEKHDRMAEHVGELHRFHVRGELPDRELRPWRHRPDPDAPAGAAE